MFKNERPLAAPAGASYELVVAPVSGAVIRMPVHATEIASLLDGGRLLIEDEGGRDWVVELVRADGVAQQHYGRARARSAAELDHSQSEEPEAAAGGPLGEVGESPVEQAVSMPESRRTVAIRKFGVQGNMLVKLQRKCRMRCM